jgi:hypothetical protein
MPLRQALLAAVRAQIGGSSAEWFEQALGEAARGSLPQLLRAYTGASRRLGAASLAIDDAAAVSRELDAVSVGHWTLEDAGRLVFLLSRFEASPNSNAENRAAAVACYEQGDSREQRSWLRTVGFLPDAEQLLPVVIDACRTSILPLFEAVACENAYPAKHFPDRNFNQMVLKALFNDIALERIIGLTSRLNPELSRMASDYADERKAAGRSIPADIGVVVRRSAQTQRIH